MNTRIEDIGVDFGVQVHWQEVGCVIRHISHGTSDTEISQESLTVPVTSLGDKQALAEENVVLTW